MLTRHVARVPDASSTSPLDEIRFKWHFPRGTLRPKMSALELAQFLLPHMPHMLPLLARHPRVYKDFETMMTVLAVTPKENIDILCGWVKSVCYTSDFDYIVMCLTDKIPERSTRKYFYKKYRKE